MDERQQDERFVDGTDGTRTDTTPSTVPTEPVMRYTLAEAARRAGLSIRGYLRLVSLVGRAGRKDMLDDPTTWKRAKSDGVESVISTAVVHALGMPAEAADSGLTRDELINFVSRMQHHGLGAALRDAETWRSVGQVGPTRTLENIVREGLGVSPEFAPDADIESLAWAAATINEIGGDPSNPRFWGDFDDATRDLHGIPHDALPGASVPDLMNGLGMIHAVDGDPKNTDIWDDVGVVLGGHDSSFGRTDFYHKWGTGDSGTSVSPSGSTGTSGGTITDPTGTDDRGLTGGTGSDVGTGVTGDTGGTSTTGDPHAGSGDSGATSPGDTGDISTSGSSDPGGSDTSGSTTSGPSPSGGGGDTDSPVQPGVVVEVTHTGDGGYHVDAWATDSGGITEYIGGETYHDTDGDGVWEGDRGGSITGPQPDEGFYEVVQTSAGAGFGSTDSDGSSDGSGGSSSDSSDSDDGSDGGSDDGSDGGDDGSNDDGGDSGDDDSTPAYGVDVYESWTLPQLIQYMFNSEGFTQKVASAIMTNGEASSGSPALYPHPGDGVVDPVDDPVGAGDYSSGSGYLSAPGSGVIDPTEDAVMIDTGLGSGYAPAGPTEPWVCQREFIIDDNGNGWCYCPVAFNPQTGAPIEQWQPYSPLGYDPTSGPGATEYDQFDPSHSQPMMDDPCL